MNRKKTVIGVFAIFVVSVTVMFSVFAGNSPIREPFSPSAFEMCSNQGYIESASAEIESPGELELEPFKTYRGNVGYVAAGIGVRNTGRGTISLRVPKGAGLVDAWLYWVILDNGENPRPDNDLIDVNGIRVRGTLVGSGFDPCWGPASVDTGFTYRANIHYELRQTGGLGNQAGAFGINIGGVGTYKPHGESPWDSPPTADWMRPLAESVGLIIIFKHGSLPSSGIVEIYDGYYMQASGAATFTYNWPAHAAGGCRFSHLTADGQQVGASFFAKNLDFNGTVIDQTFLNGYDPSLTSKATYQGSLADTDTYNVGTLVNTAGGSTPITWNLGGDCISWAALVFWTDTDSPY